MKYEELQEVMELVPEGGYWRDLPVEVQKRVMGVSFFSTGGRTAMFRRLHRDRPSPTIVGSPMQKMTLLWHPFENRPISAEEASVLMSYPTELEPPMRYAGAGRTSQSTSGQRPRELDEPAHTVTGKDTGAWLGDDGDWRKATTEEYAVLQSYPDQNGKEELTEHRALKALDLFAGTGWGVACRWLGIEEWGVELMPEAVRTREANGMRTVYNDVWDGLEDPETYQFDYDLLIASPPCQTFSMAGKGTGRKALDDVLAAITSEAWKNVEHLRQLGEDVGDERTALVLTPLAHVYRDNPEFVVLEQVPQVLPVWEATAVAMRELGYSVWTGVLSSEQYGVPQTRKRAILIGRRDGKEAKPPVPTHSAYYPRDPKRLDPGVPKWVSMAEAFGWGLTARPSYTVTGGGRETGGYEAFPTGARQGMDRAQDEGEFAERIQRSNYSTGSGAKAGDTAEERGRSERELDKPSVTVTSKGFQWKDGEELTRVNEEEIAALQSYPAGVTEDSVYRNGNQAHAAKRELDKPAPTLHFGERANKVEWMDKENADDPAASGTRVTREEASTLQSYPRGEGLSSGLQPNSPIRPIDEPATTQAYGHDSASMRWTDLPEDGQTIKEVVKASSEKLTVEEAAILQSYPRPEDEQWKWKDTPSTTIAGDPRITAREHHFHGEQNSTSFKLEQDEAHHLQTFPRPWVWVGNKGKTFQQIGNAVPPLLGYAVLKTLFEE